MQVVPLGGAKQMGYLSLLQQQNYGFLTNAPDLNVGTAILAAMPLPFISKGGVFSGMAAYGRCSSFTLSSNSSHYHGASMSGCAIPNGKGSQKTFDALTTAGIIKTARAIAGTKGAIGEFFFTKDFVAGKSDVSTATRSQSDRRAVRGGDLQGEVPDHAQDSRRVQSAVLAGRAGRRGLQQRARDPHRPS